MVLELIQYNSRDLKLELDWFAHLLDVRMQLYFGQECSHQSIEEIAPPDFGEEGSLYAQFIHHYQPILEERIALVLAMTPHIRPQLLDVFFSENARYARGFTEFGGIKGQQHSGFLPTGETLAFILAADNLEQRIFLNDLFDRDHFFARHHILKLEPAPENEPFLSGVLKVSKEFLDYFTDGQVHKPDFSLHFPAKHITTEMEWDDLVLEEETYTQLEEIRAWMKHGDTLLYDWGLKKKVRPGYRCLFYGSPGTGKTLTACLLGKSTERDVYRVDLSMVISKYIGETEKNLSKVFEQAESKDWILFFDEADALFGKRTKIENSHDRFANQEVSYLLQRIENYDGMVVLASNMKSNLDKAFIRRFESIIHFPKAKAPERLRLWEKGFSAASRLSEEIKLEDLARNHELSGGSIMNVVRYSSLMALSRESNEIILKDIKEGIRKEFQKEGKTL